MAVPQIGAQKFAELRTEAGLVLTISAMTIEVPKGKIIVCYDFVPDFEDAQIKHDPTITASLFSLRPNPNWYLSSTQAEQLTAKIESLHFELAPSAKPFGGFRIDGIALANYQYLWVTGKMVYATGLDGDEWIGADTQGLDETIRANFATRYPCYQQ